MKPTLSDFYGANFYSRRLEGTANSAKNILSLLYKYYEPKSVVDVGCGRGEWLDVAGSFGSNRLKGFDGSWVKKEDILNKNIDFSVVNFDVAMPEIEEKYDLCISVEVAEHISERNAKSFVDVLCRASDVILFSAAIKDQGGLNHINEQWQSYWADFFKSNGYECFDVLRAPLWTNEFVKWWYRQNIFIFQRKNSNKINSELLRAAERPILDIVHPGNYEGKIKANLEKMNAIQYPTLRFCLGCAKRYIAIKIRRLVGISASLT